MIRDLGAEAIVTQHAHEHEFLEQSHKAIARKYPVSHPESQCGLAQNSQNTTIKTQQNAAVHVKTWPSFYCVNFQGFYCSEAVHI